MGFFSRNNLITQSFQFIKPTTKHLKIRFKTFHTLFYASKLPKDFVVVHIMHPMIQIILKSMKK
jgi:hypothetical protein